MAIDKLTSQGLAPGAVTANSIDDNSVTAAKLHITAIQDKLGYTPVDPAQLQNQVITDSVITWASQFGQSTNQTQNFTLFAPSDGTIRLSVGNIEQITTEVLNITNSGEFRCTNSITSFFSDERLKKDIKPIENALDKVCSLRGVTYKPNDIAESFGFVQENMMGLLAGDVENNFPEAVKPAPFDLLRLQEGIDISKSGENYRTVKYEMIVPALVEAIKELREEVKKLKGEQP